MVVVVAVGASGRGVEHNGSMSGVELDHVVGRHKVLMFVVDIGSHPRGPRQCFPIYAIRELMVLFVRCIHSS